MEKNLKLNDVMQLMRNHSSVRSYTDRLIDNDLLNRIVQSGQCAASSSFIQAYSVIRVSDQQNRALIAKAAGNQQWILDAPEFLMICADMLRIQACCVNSSAGSLEGYTEHFITATVDAALMAQNMMLAAEAAGLGGVFIGGIRNQPEVVANCLELPEQVYPVFGLCLGWPASQQAVKPRLPVDVILHQEKYQSSNLQNQLEKYDRQMAGYYVSRKSNAKNSNWSEQTASAVQGKKRKHMLNFLQSKGFLKR